MIFVNEVGTLGMRRKTEPDYPLLSGFLSIDSQARLADDETSQLDNSNGISNPLSLRKPTSQQANISTVNDL
jgi:hypothetical protein